MDWELFYRSFRKPGFVPGFEIQNRLGGGAFGDVYKARKVSINKPYAVKFLKVDDQTQAAGIERELEQVRHFAAIDHPNLVTIEDMGVALDVPYLIMGYAGEDTLAKRMRRERLDLDNALSFFVQTCRGVSALHKRRLAHFDLKPSNIFLKGESARVGDYGLAKLMIDGRQTLSFGRGTPHYMAPEMLKNRGDQRADIYSLGVILYETVAGALPYPSLDGIGPLGREDDKAPPFPDDFPIPLQLLVTRCLRLSPDARPQTVDELLEEIGQSTRAGDPVLPLKMPRFAAAGEAAQAAAGAAVGAAVELRATATELARGAAQVARGFWDGLREGASTPSPNDGPANGSPNGKASAPDARSSPAPSDAVPVAGRQPLFARAGVAAEAARDPAFAPTSVSAGAEPASAPAAASGATVPVPPRAEGSWWSHLGNTLALGLEVLVSLFVLPVRRAWSRTERAREHAAVRTRAAARAALRTAVFAATMVLLGAGVTWVLLNWLAL